MNGENYIEIYCDSDIEHDFDEPTRVYRMYATYISCTLKELRREYIPGTASESEAECYSLLTDARSEFPEIASLPLTTTQGE